MVKVSLRTSLVGLWLLILIICLALAVLMTGLFKLGVSAEIKSVQRGVLRANRAMQQRFDLYLATYSPPPKDFSEDQKRRELGLIVQLALADYKGVEGGFWSERGGFVAYAYPTYEGERPKKDVPEAEEGRIAKVAADALQNGNPQERRFDGQTESLILCARPVGGSEQMLAAWTMARAHVSAGAAYQRLTVGFVILFTFALASGIWLLWFLQRWSRHIALLEKSIAAVPVEELPPLPETGQIELDRIIMALNGLNSKLKKSREESYELSRSLAKADRLAMLGHMAAEVAHEIRNPIAAMRLRAENALAKSAEHHGAALEFIMPEILRLDELLERLLAVARLDELKFGSVHLRSWLAQRIDALRERAEQGSVSLTGEASDVEWRFDERGMTRALDNLILNSLRYTSPGGWVKVTIDARGSLCLMIVEDSGPGISPEQRETIFEPLYTTRSEGGGLGLGLGIAREIVEAHGGTLRCVDSPVGARFEIELPCQKS